MATHSRRGQALVEILLSIMFIFTVVVFLLRLHQAHHQNQKKYRWELRKDHYEMERMEKTN